MPHQSFPIPDTIPSSCDDESKGVDRYIGGRIQAVRKAKNISQKGLMRQLATPLSQQQLSRYEQGVSSIPSKLLFEISIALEVTTETFMPLKTSLAKKTSLPLPQLDSAVEAALTSFSLAANVTSEEVKQLEKMLKQFYKR